MEISIVNGSPRTQGATGTILRETAAYLTTRYGASITYYDLSKLSIEYCRGCESCYKTGKCCIRTDDFEEVSARIKGADGLIIGSPTYASNVSAYLKNFIERGHFVVEQGLYGKQCFSLVTYQIADGRSALNILNKFFRVAGAAVAGSFLLKTPIDENPLADAATLARLHRQLDKYYQALETGRRKSLYEYLFNDIVVVRIIFQRYFRKYPKQFRGVLNSYRQKGIHPFLSQLH